MAVSFVETTSLPKQHSNQRGVWFPSMQKQKHAKACKNYVYIIYYNIAICNRRTQYQYPCRVFSK
jgi:hypothetical protein